MSRIRRSGLAFAAVVLVAWLQLAGSPARPASADEPPPGVTLYGAGSWDVYRALRPWQDDLYGTDGLVDLNYLANGDQFGRADFLDGSLDYVVSGEPFTATELQRLPHGADDVIDAPIFASAVAFAVVPFTNSTNAFIVRETLCDENTADDPSLCAKDIQYRDGDPVRVPSRNLAAMAFNYTVPDSSKGGIQPNRWDHPDITANWPLASYGQPGDFQPPYLTTAYPPVSYMRSEPSSTSYYLQQFAKVAAPDIWEGLKKLSPGSAFEPITESLPRIAVPSRPGVDQQIQAIESLQSGSGFPGGFIAAVPPAGFDQLAAEKPTLHPRLVEMPNASGEWVRPTPAAITAAIEAGGDHPLYALTAKATGAYPLAYVDHLYAPAHGLSVPKMEALAATIRYFATAGQDIAQSTGSGRLSKSLQQAALAAANQLVLSNCAGADTRLVSSSTPGPYSPASVSAASVGTTLHCLAVAPAGAAAPTAAPEAPAPAIDASTAGVGAAPAGPPPPPELPSQVQGFSAARPTAAEVTPSIAAGGAVPSATEPRTRTAHGVLAVSKLPLPLPYSGGGGFDRLTAVLAGALLFLVARRPLRALVRAVRA